MQPSSRAALLILLIFDMRNGDKEGDKGGVSKGCFFPF